MVYIGICDDDRCFLDYIENRIEEIVKAENIVAKIYKINNGIDLLKAYDKKNKPFDIIFLDIDMPKMDGLEVAEIIRKKDEETILIFLTSMEDVVYKAFKYDTFRFIRKSHMDKELEEALQSSLEKLKDEKHIFKTTNGDLSLYISDILYFEFMDRAVYIKTFDGIYKTNIRRFKDIEDIFGHKGFVSIHRSCMVNENYVKSLGNLDIILDNDEKLPVSRYRMEEVKRSFIKVARRG
ncbi:Two component transcriptional regulator, LytTR family [[Clostridium] ultunense Esp]|uniref:Two component transcriptional regulator, LytTR family n=1 Tax=[Clostridium] ultunense Esp TaxID=1288971 RepID=M1ZB51_9FIRM|nr:LytTR family DNA-binding domain-containing protein [Schnuerera ultunensis]CCQ95556.1 Two component transcriptional regulator, LytTR family [[Clostridium] ultunense Esp]SHD78194.1 Two component transcriptional regulator, LytTR family [[Clostridium] ultunense Esp]